MNIDLALKDLIPFGSALLGAGIGGTITYGLFTVKERKEGTKKQLESLFEIQKINYKLLSSFNELLGNVSMYIFLPNEQEKFSADEITDMIQKCSDNLAEMNVVSLAHAVHMKNDMFELVKQAHEDTRQLYLKVTEGNKVESVGYFKIYSQQNVIFLEKAIKRIAILQRELTEKEKQYVEQYMKKYNKYL
ncbi:hypothetical protein CN644_23995 [Bacillus wiedmannii]|uniref:hypothetical protein n=1 Tax=Bacillus wiedmannii TaxID=1890302 RepID=UPI000BEFF5A2|nr:hypothetical protein [Bacillus wiedmannii]PEI32374.1 hypothetical protein CN644_23995 [Bacillus wiedmannii]PEM03486.1 hypothetical protein CN604_02995 [Bacillus wiedmannii]